MNQDDYIKNLEAVLYDLFSGTEIRRVRLSKERSKEIQDFFNNEVKPKYLKKHGIES